MQKTEYYRYWLFLCIAMVILMIAIGGITRLTHSGLSITKWKPIVGIIPPITSQDWEIEFEDYKKSPEYIMINNTMTIVEFKFIFWLEFIHRVLGRLTGLIYLIPLIYLFINRKLQIKSIKRHIVILSLFILQGYMGWYMVKSGLIDKPHVSHFRLSAHLIIACIIYTLLLLELLDQILIKNTFGLDNILTLKVLCYITLGIVYLQIILGAFTAGLHAGLVYNTFPLMGNSFIPEEINILSINFESFNNPVFVQFIHRIIAYLISIMILILSYMLFLTKIKKLQFLAMFLLISLVLQILLGVFTLLLVVPLYIALMHQLGAVLLLSGLVYCYFILTQK